MKLLSKFSKYLTRLDNTIDEPDPEVIEKRLHSLLLLSALLLSASMTMFDLVSDSELQFLNLNHEETLIDISRVDTNENFWMGCKFIPFLCEWKENAVIYLDSSTSSTSKPHPFEIMKDSYQSMTSLSIHLSIMGLMLTMLCYLSLNHVHMEGASLHFWYKSHAILVLGSYIVTGAAAITMCFAFNALSFLKGGFNLYLATVQRTYVMGYTAMILGSYLLICLIVANSLKTRHVEYIRHMSQFVRSKVSPFSTSKNRKTFEDNMIIKPIQQQPPPPANNKPMKKKTMDQLTLQDLINQNV